MPLPEMDVIGILERKGFKKSTIARRVRATNRTIRDISNKPRYKPSSFSRDISQYAFELLSWPWSKETQIQITRMIELIRCDQHHDLYETYAFSAGVAIDTVIEAKHLAERGEKTNLTSEDLWGSILISYLFLLGVRRSSMSSLIEKYNTDTWNIVINALREKLKSIDEEWARLLSFRVALNAVVFQWNVASPRDTRSSPEMKAWMNEQGYRGELLLLNDIVPNDPDPVFNAVAIASRFEDRPSYEDLLVRFERAGENVDNLRSDDDFKDFLNWYDAKKESE